MKEDQGTPEAINEAGPVETDAELAPVVETGATEVVEVEPTREERRAMAMAMKENCESLSALLQRMVDEEQAMKEMCAEFIIRDIEEENKRIELTRRCLDEQGDTMRSTAFVKWVSERNKTADAFGLEPKAANARLPAAEPLDTFAVDVSLPAKGLHGPSRLFHCPTAFVERLLGWRTEARRADDREVADDFDELERARGSRGDTVVAVNGQLLWQCVPADDEAELANFANTVSPPQGEQGRDAQGAANQYVAWREWMMRRACEMPIRTLFEASPELHASLAADGADCITLVPLASIRSGLHFRAVAFGHRVIAAETPLPEVRLDAAVGVTLPAAVAALQTALEQTDAPTNDRKLRVLHCVCVANSDSAAIGPTITMLGTAALTPGSRLDRFEWSDLCGIARIAKESRAPPQPALRYTKHAVANLEPFDPLSESWFPVLEKPLAPQQDSSTRQRRSAGIPSSDIQTKEPGNGRAVLVGVAVVVGVIGVAGTLLSRRK
jgi:hypothetical protein